MEMQIQVSYQIKKFIDREALYPNSDHLYNMSFSFMNSTDFSRPERNLEGLLLSLDSMSSQVSGLNRLLPCNSSVNVFSLEPKSFVLTVL